jgi:hypothetical protein
MKTAMNNRLLISESHSDSNRCTPCRGKPDQHDTYASHASPCTPDVRFLRAIPVRGNLLRVVDRFGWIPLLLRKKGSWHNSQHASRPIHGSVPSFSPKPTNKAIGLLGPYHQHVIGTFKTCSRGPTHQSLTDTSGGYSVEGVGFSHTTLQPTQPTVLSFPPKGPVRTQVINQLITIWTKGRSGPKCREWEPPLDFYHNLSSKYSMS